MSQIDATTNLFSAAAANTAQTQQPSTQPARNLDKDAFLKLLVAQIKNQDPLKPSDGAQFLAQLAQFSQLEQLMEIKDQLGKLSAGSNPVPVANTTQPTGGN
jgi:flagellar basal-body rod modification protein FlgD